MCYIITQRWRWAIVEQGLRLKKINALRAGPNLKLQLLAPRLTDVVHVIEITMWGLTREGRRVEQSKQLIAPSLSRYAKTRIVAAWASLMVVTYTAVPFARQSLIRE